MANRGEDTTSNIVDANKVNQGKNPWDQVLDTVANTTTSLKGQVEAVVGSTLEGFTVMVVTSYVYRSSCWCSSSGSSTYCWG